MKINYPDDIKTDNDKVMYLYRLQELMRLDFNSTGEKYRNSLISKAEWNDYISNTFEIRRDLINEEILSVLKRIRENETNTANLNDIS